jgi:hypothetical protein
MAENQRSRPPMPLMADHTVSPGTAMVLVTPTVSFMTDTLLLRYQKRGSYCF